MPPSLSPPTCPGRRHPSHRQNQPTHLLSVQGCEFLRKVRLQISKPFRGSFSPAYSTTSLTHHRALGYL